MRARAMDGSGQRTGSRANVNGNEVALPFL